MVKATPMVQQYLSIKENHPDAILFFRMGDFYEMFFEDAKVASRILDIALTSRNKKDEESIPEILDDNLQFCLVCGHCVAICPAGAITHDSFPPGSIVPVRKEELPSTEQVMAIPELLSLPANHQIYGALAMGYPKFKYKNWIVRKPAKVEWIV